MKILLLEDDFAYRQSIKEYLENLGFEVDEAQNGEIACEKIASTSYHLLILDVKVPLISGFEVLEFAKSLNLNTPIMIMTSLIDINNLEIGYNLGCNEYLKKPFEIAELKFRINELLKKHYNLDKNRFKIAGDFYYEICDKALYKDGKIIDLSSVELKIVQFLLNKKRFCETYEICDEVFDQKVENGDIRMHIMKIRKKTSENFIISKRGLGYKINV